MRRTLICFGLACIFGIGALIGSAVAEPCSTYPVSPCAPTHTPPPPLPPTGASIGVPLLILGVLLALGVVALLVAVIGGETNHRRRDLFGGDDDERP